MCDRCVCVMLCRTCCSVRAEVDVFCVLFGFWGSGEYRDLGGALPRDAWLRLQVRWRLRDRSLTCSNRRFCRALV